MYVKGEAFTDVRRRQSTKVTSHLDLYGTSAAVCLCPIVDSPALVLLGAAQRASSLPPLPWINMASYLEFDSTSAAVRLGPIVDSPARTLVMLCSAQRASFPSPPPPPDICGILLGF